MCCHVGPKVEGIKSHTLGVWVQLPERRAVWVVAQETRVQANQRLGVVRRVGGLRRVSLLRRGRVECVQNYNPV